MTSRLALLAAAILAGGAAHSEAAEPGARPWSVGLAAQADERSSTSVLTTFNWGVAESTWLTVAAARSRSPSDRADVSVRSLHAGVDHRFGWLGLSFDGGLWGDPDALESTEYRGSLYLAGERFRVGLERELRDIDIVFTVTGPLGRQATRTVGLDATGTGLRARIELADRVRMMLASRRYSYSRDLTLLPRIAQLNLLRDSPLTLAWGFLSWEHAIDFEWESGERIVSFGYARDRSAVDRSQLETWRAAVLFPVARRMDLELSLGHGRSRQFSSGTFGGVLLLIYGG